MQNGANFLVFEKGTFCLSGLNVAYYTHTTLTTDDSLRREGWVAVEVEDHQSGNLVQLLLIVDLWFENSILSWLVSLVRNVDSE